MKFKHRISGWVGHEHRSFGLFKSYLCLDGHERFCLDSEMVLADPQPTLWPPEPSFVFAPYIPRAVIEEAEKRRQTNTSRGLSE